MTGAAESPISAQRRNLFHRDRKQITEHVGPDAKLSAPVAAKSGKQIGLGRTNYLKGYRRASVYDTSGRE